MQQLPSIVVSPELPLYHLSSLFPGRRFTALLPSLVKHFLRISCSVALSAIRPQLTRSSAALGRPTSFTASQRQRQTGRQRQRDREGNRLAAGQVNWRRVAKRKAAPAALAANFGFSSMLIMINVNNSAWHTNAIKGLQLQPSCERETSYSREREGERE